MENEKPNSLKSLEELLDELANCEEAQHKIYAVYTRAAEADIEMRNLKSKEKTIRFVISVKVGK